MIEFQTNFPAQVSKEKRVPFASSLLVWSGRAFGIGLPTKDWATCDLGREFNGFFFICISMKLSLPAESRSQVLPYLKVSRSYSFHRTRNSLPNWATWLDRASIEREWQRWHNCHKSAMQVHVQVEAFACNIYGGLQARAHCSIQTTVVLAESSIPATLPSKFKTKSLQTATPKGLDSTLSL